MDSKSPYLALEEVNLNSRSQSIKGRLLRKWEARNFKRGRELMSVEFLLLDQKNCLIQGSIHHKLLSQFTEHLKEGRVFVIKEFDVLKSGNLYKMTDHQFMIRFTDDTSIEEVDDENHFINEEKFRIRSYNDLIKLADSNEDLPDVIGFLCKIHKPLVVTASGSRRLMLRIIMEEELIAYITIWDELADCANDKLHQINEKTIVILATSINPKIFAGNLYLNTTSASKIFLNSEFGIEKDFRERMRNAYYFDGNVNQSEITKLEEKCHSIFEMFKFISEEREQEKEFICIAKVLDILSQKGWNYISCSKCSRKMGRSELRLKCFSCNSPQAIGVLRFRIEATVDDGKDITTFVIFDKDVNKLINKTTSDVKSIDDVDSENAANNESIPACILGIVERTFKFHVQVTPYNFKAKHQTFTVMRIMDEILMSGSALSNEKEKIELESTKPKERTLQVVKIEKLGTDSEGDEEETLSTKKRRLQKKMSKRKISE